jgi:hypothetical protein
MRAECRSRLGPIECCSDLCEYGLGALQVCALPESPPHFKMREAKIVPRAKLLRANYRA